MCTPLCNPKFTRDKTIGSDPVGLIVMVANVTVPASGSLSKMIVYGPEYRCHLSACATTRVAVPSCVNSSVCIFRLFLYVNTDCHLPTIADLNSDALKSSLSFMDSASVGIACGDRDGVSREVHPIKMVNTADRISNLIYLSQTNVCIESFGA